MNSYRPRARTNRIAETPISSVPRRPAVCWALSVAIVDCVSACNGDKFAQWLPDPRFRCSVSLIACRVLRQIIHTVTGQRGESLGQASSKPCAVSEAWKSASNLGLLRIRRGGFLVVKACAANAPAASPMFHSTGCSR